MEDCLLLNIYVPKTNSSQNMPVMVWIHGGSLITGSNRWIMDTNSKYRRWTISYNLELQVC